MKLARYQHNDTSVWINFENGAILDHQAEHLADILQEGLGDLQETEQKIEIQPEMLQSPVTQPCRIVCQGTNYGAHREETGSTAQKPAFNLIFTKADSSLAGPNTAVQVPKQVQLLDYEIELGLVIGKEINNTVEINEDNWHEYIAGLVVVNDLSARDIQLTQAQWYKGKSYRGFCPTGPYILPMTAEIAKRLGDLKLRLLVNGQLRQEAYASQMLFKPAETLQELAGLMDLAAGDLLITGTPGGVALQAPSPLIQKLGTLLFPEQKRLQKFINRQKQNPKYLQDRDIVQASIRTDDGTIDLGSQEFVISR
jgi:2-keto-4-pentenoate hydratase/2-oxohepta-3-ene-1,7-dioic acid hydratase in catechol pathway